MKVCCKLNNINDLREKGLYDRISKYFHLSDGMLNLTLNAQYTVYGVLFRENAPWYYLCNDYDDEYPRPFPAELFQVVEPQFSSSWVLSTHNTRKGDVCCSLVFDEWADDPGFYERLIEGEPQAIALFQKYRKLIDNEIN